MYDIMLAGMRRNFTHQLEGSLIARKTFAELNAAIGTGLDLNDKQMHADDDDAPPDPNADTKRMSRVSRMTHAGEETPIDAVITYAIKFADKKRKTARSFFNHKKLAAEMFMVPSPDNLHMSSQILQSTPVFGVH